VDAADAAAAGGPGRRAVLDETAVIVVSERLQGVVPWRMGQPHAPDMAAGRSVGRGPEEGQWSEMTVGVPQEAVGSPL
jgi:hypothetical protein